MLAIHFVMRRLTVAVAALVTASILAFAFANSPSSSVPASPAPASDGTGSVGTPRATSSHVAVTPGGRTPTPADSPTPSTSPGTSSGPPNVVMLLLDDVPYLDPQTPWQATPQIASTFIEHGVTFSDFHGETPLCCPGRAGFLTGLHTFNHHVTWNSAALFNPSMSLATALHDRGYYTFLVGKYFNLYDRIAPSMPTGWDGFHATDGSPKYFDYSIWNNGNPKPQFFGSRPDRYSTDVLAQKAVMEIRSAPADKPVFAWVGLNAAHGPMIPAPAHANAACNEVPAWTAPNVAEANISDKPLYLRQLPKGPAHIDLTRLCRMLMSVDDAFASIRDELIAEGRWNNTVFVLTSDNGMAYGAHRLGLDKRTPYTTQLPFMVSWPAGLGTSPRTIDDRLQNIDFAPTICELTGCVLGPYVKGPQKPDGLSFAGLLLGTAPGPVRDAVLSGYPERKSAIPQWDAVTTTVASPLARVGCAAAGTGGCIWHYVRYATGEIELYDDSNGPCWAWSRGAPGDPCELRNLSGDPRYARLLAKLDARLNAFLPPGGR